MLHAFKGFGSSRMYQNRPAPPHHLRTLSANVAARPSFCSSARSAVTCSATAGTSATCCSAAAAAREPAASAWLGAGCCRPAPSGRPPKGREAPACARQSGSLDLLRPTLPTLQAACCRLEPLSGPGRAWRGQHNPAAAIGASCRLASSTPEFGSQSASPLEPRWTAQVRLGREQLGLVREPGRRRPGGGCRASMDA